MTQDSDSEFDPSDGDDDDNEKEEEDDNVEEEDGDEQDEPSKEEFSSLEEEDVQISVSQSSYDELSTCKAKKKKIISEFSEYCNFFDLRTSSSQYSH